jgi:L-Ala-D/L-Glu epimerase
MMGPGPGLTTEVLRLPLRDPFRGSGEPEGETAEVTTTVIVERADGDGTIGIGEATPYPYYGETTETIDAVLPLLDAAVSSVERSDGDAPTALAYLGAAAAAMDGVLRHHGAAKCGIDVALHDAAAKRSGVPLFELLGTDPVSPPTDMSLGLDAPERVAERAAQFGRFPSLKVKVGGEADIETLEAVRGVYSGSIRVDANRGWQPEGAERWLPILDRLGVELIEQPFGARDYDALGWLQERSPVPVVADESVFSEEDLSPLVGKVAGINVKLAKCGGIDPARHLIARARELGFKVMLGCVGETSLGIAASAALGSLVDWVDLDSSLLLTADPFQGPQLDEACRWVLPETPGIGVTRRS